MSEQVTLITPTGGRQECFNLCEKFVARQTYPASKIQWIVIDDCEEKTKVTGTKEVYPGPKIWKPGINTQRLNLDLAFKKITGDYVLFIEDDDWYSPKYIETMVNLLQEVSIVGEGNCKYYNVQMPGYKEMANISHSSLCQTGIRKDALPFLEWAINSGELYIDIVLWRLAREKRIASALFSELNLAIGMKKLPGRTGIGLGHRQKDYTYDQNHIKLEHWIGEDANLYKKYTQNNLLKDY